ncbi:iron-containing alcohol dehydrogenase [Verrucomicrobiales bacterium BCK34]|nr:iron-containing alcohol dehydrogenase [Verrucomicrobiales bacterium BCK34]
MSHSPFTIESLCEGFDIPDRVQGFSDIPGGKVIFGCGTVDRVGAEARALGARRVLVVTDPGLARTNAVARVVESIEAAGLASVVYAEVHENPTTRDVDRCVAAAKEGDVDLIVGLGGGSSMDTAKGCNFLLTNGGQMKDYWGVGKATQPMLPLIAVPTTSGTGSECQSFALIADAESHAKMACGDKKAAAAVAILDPELTVTMPTAVTAHTGIDAIAHALETAVCSNRTEMSSEYSRAGWILLDSGLARVLEDRNDLEARARMQLGSAFAGIAIENSMLGIAHSCANPLTAHFNVVHGQAVGTMLPHVINFNSRLPEVAAIYASLCKGGALESRIKEHLRICSMDKPLSGLGVSEDSIGVLSEEAARQWTAQFNPVPVDASDLEGVYRSAF